MKATTATEAVADPRTLPQHAEATAQLLAIRGMGFALEGQADPKPPGVQHFG